MTAEHRGAVCAVCKKWTDTPRPLRYIERQSGPGVTLYGCPKHAPEPSPTEETRER
ncbi:conserved hypothetical protein [Streptomyces sp. SPB78]|nr:conserved hypothetical protein [Streptomyces sp. SPB78]EFK99944.1 conserved hypothetical protein [Streptomyces sp. SPB78]SCD89901.1 hypothetical protein GA0115252_123731 [Streptomyces sp. DfronAA-171]